MAGGTTPRGVHSIQTLPTWLVRSVGRDGWLEDWRLAAALVILGLTLAAGWTVLAVRDRRAGRHRRHPVPRRAGLAGLVTLLLLAGAGLGVNAYVGYAPDLTTLMRTAPDLIRGSWAGSTGPTTALADSGRYP